MQSVIVAVRRFDAMESTAMNQYYYQQQKQQQQSSSCWQQGSDWLTMEKDDIREGEGCNDSSKYDIDNAFPDIDLKLQNLLGHFRKDFEGVGSVDIQEYLNPQSGYHNARLVRSSSNTMFGDYGSFLSALEKFPSRLSEQKSLMPVQNYNLLRPTNNGSIEKTARPVNPDPPAKGSSAGTGAREEDKKKLILRLKMNPDSVSNHRNTAMYTDLGLQPSNSPSLECSPNKSQMDLTEAESLRDLSPLSIIQIMTSYEAPGGSILSPLPKIVLELSAQKNELRTEKTKLKDKPILNSRGSEFKNDAEKKSRMAKDSDSRLSNISSKPSFKGSFEENTQTVSASNIGKNIIKGTELRTEGSNSLANKGNGFLSKVGQKESEIYGNTTKISMTKKELVIQSENETYKKQGQGHVKEATKEIGDKDFVSDAIKTNKESNQVTKVSLSKISKTHKEDNVLNGAKGTTTEKDLGQLVIHKKTGINKVIGKDCGSQKATKGQKKDGLRASCKDSRKEMYDKDSLLAETSVQGDKEHKVSLKVTAKGLCRDGAKVTKNEQVDVKKEVNVVHCKDILKPAKFECSNREPSKAIKREKNREVVGESDFKKGQNTSVSKDHVSNIIDTQPLPAQTATQDPALVPAGPVVINDHWVCCDICQKWRLLPGGVEPSSLPQKWLCRMLYWLPGMNRCDVPEQDTTQGLYNLYGVSQAQVQSEANQGKIDLPAAVVSAPLQDTKQAYQIQEPKALQSSKKIGNIKKGVVQRSLPNESDMVKLSSSFVGKNERPGANSKNKLSESKMGKSYGSIGLPHSDDEANLIGAGKQKNPVREEKLKRISGSKDCNTGPFDVCTLKVKRKMDNELKESKSSSKKAKTEVSEAFLGHAEAVDLPCPKVKPSKPECKISTSSKKANEDTVKTSKGDFLQEADHTVRVGPRRNEGEPYTSSGSKLMKFKDTTKILKHETSDCSLAGDSKYKDQQQATKKRKLKEWKESQTSQQGLLETGSILDHGPTKNGETESEPRRLKALMTERTGPCGSKGDDKKHKVRKLSSYQDTMLDEMEGKSKVHVIKEHGMEQFTGCNIMKKVSDGTELSKKISIARPSCVSTTSSSSKVSSYPKTLASLQGVRESPVESSVSSSPLRNQKVEKFSLARGNIAGMQALNGSGGRGCKQFLKNKTKSENVYKQFVNANDEHFAADCKQDGRREDCTKQNDVIDASYENRVVRVKSLRVQESGKDESVSREKGGDMLDEEGREIRCFDSHSKSKAGTFPCKAGSSSLQHSSGRERSSDWSLSERNVEAETNSNKVKPKASPHSANGREEQCHDFGLEGLLNKNNQLEGSVLDTCSRESSRIPRDSGRSSDGALYCQMKPPMVNGSISTDNEGAIANPIKKENPQTAVNVALREATDLKQKADRAANVALREATELKQRADRAKKNGGDELGYTDLYFRASLKFFHGASILEPLNAESAKHGETQSMAVYTDTAKLCESCGNAYQQNNDFAAAALAYKCMEVACMRVILAKTASINRDQHELQVALQMTPFGESPSSSASDVDNLNNHVLMEKDPSINPVKGLGSLPSSGNHVTAPRSLVSRILQHTLYVKLAVEASAKAKSAFAALKDSKYGAEKISAVEKVIDLSFSDVDKLLHLVHLAMKATGH